MNEEFPFYCKLHGDFRFDSLKNLSADLANQNTNLCKAFVAAGTRFGLVVGGYSGRDASVMLTAFILAADCGMTPYQLAGLTPSQILTDERAIEIPAKQLARRLPLGERAWSALMRWMAFCQREGHPTTEYIFASPEAGKGKLHVPRFAASAKAWLDLRHPSEDGKIGL